MKIAVLTDSASNINQEYFDKHQNLFVIPLMISIDDKLFRDQVEISASRVYEQLDHHDVKTSLPKLSDLEATLKVIKEEGYTHLVVVNISSGLSGTFNAFRLALNEVTDLEILHYDTKTLAYGEGFVVEYALELIEKGIPFNQFKALLDELRYKDSIAMYTLNTLKYLKEGGRIGKVEGTIGDLLHIKPVITVNNEGEYITLSKAFGLKRSLLKMKSIISDTYGDSLIDLTVHYGNNETLALELADKLLKSLNIRHIKLICLTPVLGVHTGPDMIAYIVRRVKE